MQFLGQLWIIAAVLFLRANFVLFFTILWEKKSPVGTRRVYDDIASNGQEMCKGDEKYVQIIHSFDIGEISLN